MHIRFWGVRGSLPSPGPATIRYGGNTSCVSIDLDDDTVLVLDAGSGFRALGGELAARRCHVILLLTHIHWDHIQGFPFFSPIYVPGQRVTILNNRSPDWVARLFAQMDGSYFPVRFEHLTADIEIELGDGARIFEPLDVEVTSIEMNHPGGCLGYRIERGGRSFVYMPDNELGATPPGSDGFRAFADFARGADLLVHDAQYVDADLPLKTGWGHSIWRDACDLAAAAEVERLALFHHDPARSDTALDALQERARTYLAERAPAVEVFAAQEGYALDLAPAAPARL